MPDQPQHEAEFLQWQADQAKAAFDQTWDEFKQSLRDSAKLKVWAQRHPWLVTGAAAAGGFWLATMVLSPSQAPKVVPGESEVSNGQPQAAEPERRQARFAWLLRPLWELLQPMLGQMVGSMMGAVAGAVGASAAGVGAQTVGTAGGAGGAAGGADGETSADGYPRDAGPTSAAEGPVPL